MPRTQTSVPDTIGNAATKLRDMVFGGAEGVIEPSQETVSAKPTRKQTTKAIMAEVGCNRADAARTIDWLGEIIEECRKADYDMVYPSQQQLDDPAYDVFEAMWPHGESPESGTAGDTLTRHLLDDTKGETGIWHDMVGERGREYCGMGITTGSV